MFDFQSHLEKLNIEWDREGESLPTPHKEITLTEFLVSTFTQELLYFQQYHWVQIDGCEYGVTYYYFPTHVVAVCRRHVYPREVKPNATFIHVPNSSMGYEVLVYQIGCEHNNVTRTEIIPGTKMFRWACQDCSLTQIYGSD